MNAECPTPEKERYATRGCAESNARLWTGIYGPELATYPCQCGWFHLTTHKAVNKNRQNKRRTW